METQVHSATGGDGGLAVTIKVRGSEIADEDIQNGATIAIHGIAFEIGYVAFDISYDVCMAHAGNGDWDTRRIVADLAGDSVCSGRQAIREKTGNPCGIATGRPTVTDSRNERCVHVTAPVTLYVPVM
jgi:hypothetical protein